MQPAKNADRVGTDTHDQCQELELIEVELARLRAEVEKVQGRTVECWDGAAPSELKLLSLPVLQAAGHPTLSARGGAPNHKRRTCRGGPTMARDRAPPRRCST
jgi:hypothetical protein